MLLSTALFCKLQIMVVHHDRLRRDINHMEIRKKYGVGLVVKSNIYGWYRRNAQYCL
jgi:hypothetical protein